MIRARRVNINTMVVTGIDPKAPKKAVVNAGEDYAEYLQDLLATLYNNEKVVGGKLEANDAAYTAWKKKNGYSTKRGQLTGHTLEVLQTETLTEVTVRGKGKHRKCVVVIKRSTFYRLVGDYIEHYEKKKVPNETITAFKSGWARNARRFFTKVEA